MRTPEKKDFEPPEAMAEVQDSVKEESDQVSTNSLERWDAMVVRTRPESREESKGSQLDEAAESHPPVEAADRPPSAGVDNATSTVSDTDPEQLEKRAGASRDDSLEKGTPADAGNQDTAKFSLNFQANLSPPRSQQRITKPVAPVARQAKAVEPGSGAESAATDSAASADKLTSMEPADQQSGTVRIESTVKSDDARNESPKERNPANEKNRGESISSSESGSPERQGGVPIPEKERPVQPIEEGSEERLESRQPPLPQTETTGTASQEESTPEDKAEETSGSQEDAEAGPLVVEEPEPQIDTPEVSKTGLSAGAGMLPEDRQLIDGEATLLPAVPESAEIGLIDSSQIESAGYRSSIVVGFLLLLLGFGGFGAWAILAPLKSGIMAVGVVKLAGERKTVQHLEGGIIAEILVKEGEEVEAGQVLIRLDETKAKAILESQTAAYYAYLSKEGRLKSERDDLDKLLISEILDSVSDDPEVQNLIQGEQRLLAARRAAIKDELDLFESWSEGYKREIAGLEAQRTAARRQLVHIADELKSVETLYKKGLIDKPRLLTLKRTAAGLTGEIGAYTASIARAEQKISESKLRGMSLKTKRMQEITTELQSVETSLRQFQEQLPALQDTFNRLEIRAPRSGRIVNLKYHTSGGVITPSTPILDIVPEDDKLIIEAMVLPTDIDIVVPGMEAQIQLTAYNTRKTPPIPGRVTQVSADRVEDAATGQMLYQALVEIDQKSLLELENVKLYPGMPASVQIVSGERTALDYLLVPIQDGLRRTWLED